MSYQPKGKVATFLCVVEADLTREFTSRQVAEIMDCDPRAVSSTLGYAVRYSLIFRRWVGKSAIWRGNPYNPDEVRRAKDASDVKTGRSPLNLKSRPAGGWQPEPGDPRIPRVIPGWTPPRMVCVRLGQ